jgi:hypothetical protein
VDASKSSALAHCTAEEKRLHELEEKLRHELLSVEERGELEDLVLHLRRRLRLSR